MRMRLPTTLLASTCVILVMAPSTLAAEQKRVGTEAKRILEASGVQGGLVVHLGCGDGTLTAALRVNDRYLVHGLDTDQANVAKARAHIRSLGRYGPVSVDAFGGRRLPYIDNLVNLVIAEDLGGVPIAEVMRVLAPKGVAILGGKKTVKPWPQEIDEWTHYMHNPTGNAVARDDVVGPPRRVQWVSGPRWARSHEHTASLHALVSAGGRIFFVMDEGSRASIQLPAKYTLTAKDAFNGTTLWKRELPRWFNHLYPLKSGPGYMPRRLVAVGETVFVSSGVGEPLLALEAATGKVLHEYKDTATTVDIIVSDGVLFAVVDADREWIDYKQESAFCWGERDRASTRWGWKRTPDKLKAIQPENGQVLWEEAFPIAPMTLAVDDRHVCFYDGEHVVCVDRKEGKRKWVSEPLKDIKLPLRTGYAPKVVLHGDTVLFSPFRKIYALSADNGEVMWTVKGKPRSGHFSPEDLFVIDGLVWAAGTANPKKEIVCLQDRTNFKAYDLKTGAHRRTAICKLNTFFMHQRCYPGKATERYLIPATTGTEFVDLDTGSWEIHHWVRGGCIYGMLPCNGLLYATPHACACYFQSKLNSFNALAPAAKERRIDVPEDDIRLEQGLAYGKVDGVPSRLDAATASWPTYRHDNKRSGSTRISVSSRLQPAWKTKLGPRLSPITVADGKLFVSAIDEHQVIALDAASGKRVWDFTAGGRVDSPPTIYQGMALFGCADGYVYALRASDGELVWRFRAAPMDERLTSYGQVESVWPVSGAVLIQDDVLYAVAGRCAFLDDGMRMIRLRPKSGELISETVLDDKIPGTDKNLQEQIARKHMPVALPDILSSDGKHVYMKSQVFDLDGKRTRTAPQTEDTHGGEETHLFSPISFLDDSWFHRSYWIYGRAAGEGWREWQIPGRHVPSGRIMSVDEEAVYGYARDPELLCNSSVLEYRLYAAKKSYDAERAKRLKNARQDSVHWKNRAKLAPEQLTAVDYKWLVKHPPLIVRAMAVADETLFVAGPPDVVDEKAMWGRSNEEAFQKEMAEQVGAFEGKRGAALWAVSKKDGNRISELQLSTVPVWDGMAVADGRLFLAMADGTIVCLGGGGTPLTKLSD